MYEYPEYFDQNKIDMPYSSSSEELSDYFKLLDMVIESFLERKGLHTARKLYSSGLVITESELRGLYDNPPAIRQKDMYDPVLSEMVRSAFDYIDSRYEATGKTNEQQDSAGILPMLRVKYIRDTFSLDRNEIFAVIMALSVCVDRTYERIYGFLQDEISSPRPTTGLYFAMVKRFTKPEDMALTYPIRLSDTLERFFFPKQKEEGLSQALFLNPLIRDILSGNFREDESGSKAVEIYRENESVPVFFDREKSLLDHELSLEGDGLLYIESDDKKAPLHILFKAATDKKSSLSVLDFSKFSQMSREEKELTLMAIKVRAKLFGGIIAVLYVPDREAKNHTNDSMSEELLDEKDLGKIFVFGENEEPPELSSRAAAVLKMPLPSAELRCKMWEHFLFHDKEYEAGDDLSLADLSDCYEMSYGSIMNICLQTRAMARLENTGVITKDLCLKAIGKQSRVNFSSLASHVNAVYGWEDLKITPDQAKVLKTACDRYRIKNRLGEKWGLKKKNAYGNGVSVLLYGPPGTGKTMAAQVVSKELSLPLYRVDISRIFSKYIGETEKNLSSIFDAAKGANVILFFDEADALFSKRTEISGSNDKYSNSETAFLLQKIEEYDGMSILATNYYQNFDNAFIRRITYSVNLKSPDEEQRYQLWSTILPPETELDKDLDFRLLAAQFDLSGSNIKAILYSAAYMAGAEGAPLSMRHIARAMQYEYQKLGRLINTGEFGPLMGYLQD
ncbi:AAA family ATPase [Butyrivibrio sp. FCS014]|uniref:AAA family ATPase n=1 Tax=Butyrivibrio sp. FCS014 TaxID=1408304 RepID=UPI0004676D20|nr:ATP-binding protein [Butyrivibrio sp. FCS014]